MSKYTPGPWFIWKERAMQEEGLEQDEITAELLEYPDFCVMAGQPKGRVTRGCISGCISVVELDSQDFGEDEVEGACIALGNARLIAAAPDLLAALQRFLDYESAMNSREDVSGMLIYAEFSDMARAAIVKATGEST